MIIEEQVVLSTLGTNKVVSSNLKTHQT